MQIPCTPLLLPANQEKTQLLSAEKENPCFEGKPFATKNAFMGLFHFMKHTTLSMVNLQERLLDYLWQNPICSRNVESVDITQR